MADSVAQALETAGFVQDVVEDINQDIVLFLRTLGTCARSSGFGFYGVFSCAHDGSKGSDFFAIVIDKKIRCSRKLGSLLKSCARGRSNPDRANPPILMILNTRKNEHQKRNAILPLKMTFWGVKS